MPINLKEALKKKMQPTFGGGGDTFKCETIGDQFIGVYKGRRTVTTTRGEDADLIDVKILGGEKLDAKTKKPTAVKPGDYAVFLGTNLRKIFDAEQPGVGDTIRVQLVEIGSKGLRIHGYEVLERGDDVPDFGSPKKK
jgi:hypothetical protein